MDGLIDGGGTAGKRVCGQTPERSAATDSGSPWRERAGKPGGRPPDAPSPEVFRARCAAPASASCISVV
ncbi:MAG: hypothetical protein ACYTG0_21430 [Planctomycetota bacterium]